MLKFENVTKKFGRIIALDNVSFEISEGEFVFITGPSGAGKTTILKLILKSLKPDQGKIFLAGKDIAKLSSKKVHKLRQNIGVVFQDFKILPERTVYENVSVALAVCGVGQSEWKNRVMSVLEKVGLSERLNLFPSQLSGGELQRVSLARALVVDPHLLLADEPTGNLDWETAEEIIKLFDRINKDGKTVIVATHHRGLIDKMKKRVIEIKEGKLVSDSKVKKKSSDK